MDNDYLGIVQVGGTLYGMLLVRVSGTPTAADSSPTYTIYGPDGAMTNGTGTVTAVSGITGLYEFSHSIASGDGYASGINYTIKHDYQISAADKSTKQTFTVV